MSKEQVIISWLEANYETSEETDMILKDSLWDEFAKYEKLLVLVNRWKEKLSYHSLGDGSVSVQLRESSQCVVEAK